MQDARSREALRQPRSSAAIPQSSANLYLTVVSASLAVARQLQDTTGTSIKKIVQTLRTARSATIEINGERLTLDPNLTETTRTILKRLEAGH